MRDTVLTNAVPAAGRATTSAPVDPGAEGHTMSVQSEESRTSLYLVLRAEALLGALRFFRADAGNAGERRLQLLAQLDFWEWEIDNLIYSFTNFAERSRTWNSPRATFEKLGVQGIVVKAMVASRRPEWRDRRWRVNREPARVAPVALLKETIDLWNDLLDVTEGQFIYPMRKKANDFGIQMRKDLQSSKRTMPPISIDDEA